MEEIPKALDQALDGISRVSTLVAAMKEFSHPGRREKQNANLNDAIRSTVTVARNEWKYVAEMEMDLDPELPPVPCMVSDFNQVVLNLIVNASHAIVAAREAARTAGAVGTAAAPLGRITIRTRAIAAPDGRCAEIRVEDTGTGIPEEARGRVFDPFFTTKDVGRGTGQGLAIARSVIVDKHGGSIRFETETGKGTAFIIRLPIDLPSREPGTDELAMAEVQ
jgi:signal transduction histidine kinase